MENQQSDMYDMQQSVEVKLLTFNHCCSVFSDHSMALAHNGNLINAKMLRRELEAEGSIFQTSSDTEVLFTSY